MKENKDWLEFLPEFLLSLVVLISFFIVVDVFQYLTTEFWWIQDEIKGSHSSIIFLLLIFIISFLPMKKWSEKQPKLKYLIIGAFFLFLFAHQKYNRFYNELQQYPKVKRLSKDWGIPGSWVKVNGRNFGGEWEKGEVYLGETETNIKKWSDKEIIFEIPLSVEFGTQQLTVLNSKNKIQKEYFQFNLEKN